MSRRRLLFGSLVAAAAVAAGGPPAAAEVHALVIGINDYVNQPLKGAVNDAEDVAKALRSAGVGDLQVLLNDAAGRDGIERAWQTMLQRAGKGDTVILTYAGHGSQQPERVAGSEEDGKDEILVLGKFAAQGPGTRERIIDDELNLWFKDAGRRGLSVVFVVDACHSGTMTRGLSRHGGITTVRLLPTAPITDDELKLDLPDDAAKTVDGDLPFVTYISGAQDDQTVPELMIPGEGGEPVPRGALSYFIARAIEGEADADHDGVVSRGELKLYIRENVRKQSESRQTPNFLPPGGDDQPVFRVAPAAATGKAREILDRSPRLAVLGGSAPSLSHAVAVSREQSPELIWDAGRREVVNGLGDVVATDIGPAELQGVVDKWRAITGLQQLSRTHALAMAIKPNDGAHRRGAEVALEISGLRHPYLTLFSLAGDGTLSFHFPQPDEKPTVPVDQAVRLTFDVTPPFGADHFVAVSSPTAMPELNAALMALQGRKAGVQAVTVLARTKGLEASQLGLQGLFTTAD